MLSCAQVASCPELIWIRVTPASTRSVVTATGTLLLRGGAVAELAAGVRPPAVGGARAAQRAGEAGPDGDLGHRHPGQRPAGGHGHRRVLRAGVRAVAELAAAAGAPAVGGAGAGQRAGGSGCRGIPGRPRPGSGSPRPAGCWPWSPPAAMSCDGGRAVAQLAVAVQPPAVGGAGAAQRAGVRCRPRSGSGSPRPAGSRAVVTATGTSLAVVLPLPSCPLSLAPQQ